MVDNTSIDGEASMCDENVDVRWETSFGACANRGPPIRVPLVKEALNCTFDPTMRQLHVQYISLEFGLTTALSSCHRY